MDNLSEHLAQLRQEITHLQGLNAQYRKRREHSAIQQLKYEQWQTRLQEIRNELLTLREGPPHPAVWWDRCRRSPRA